jgi:hypothetical protein
MIEHDGYCSRTESRREFGAGADDCVSSRAGASGGRVETLANRGWQSWALRWGHLYRETAARTGLGAGCTRRRIQSEAVARVLSSDLGEDERVVAESLGAMRAEIAGALGGDRQGRATSGLDPPPRAPAEARALAGSAAPGGASGMDRRGGARARGQVTSLAAVAAAAVRHEWASPGECLRRPPGTNRNMLNRNGCATTFGAKQ